MVVLTHITEQLRLSFCSYGHPRNTKELRAVGLQVGRRRVACLMRENGIIVERTLEFNATTDSNQTFGIAPHLLTRDFDAADPNQKWAGEISFIWTREDWLYLAVILDLHSRRITGWAASQPHGAPSCNPGSQDGQRPQVAAQRIYLSQARSMRRPILFA